jgi:hypothetical protein
MRNLMTALLTQYCAGDKIEKNVMGGACSARGRGKAYTWEDKKKMDLHEVVCGGMVWIKLAQNRDR